MSINGVYAVISVTDLDRSVDWYAKLLGSAPRARPMDFLAQWFGHDVNLQLWKDDRNASHSRSTIVVADLDETSARLRPLGIELGEISRGEFGAVASVEDPDGNSITLSEGSRPT